MLQRTGRLVRRVAVEGLGWVLVLLGIAALVLPGPGLVLLALGLFVLATQYEWAERRLEPVKDAALRTAADGVATVPRILLSTLGVTWLIALGVYWGISPDAPGWWPVRESWWLPGGWGTGASLILSGLLAAALIVYSYVTFRDRTGLDADDRVGGGRARRPGA